MVFRKRKRLHSELDGDSGELSLTEYLRRKQEDGSKGRRKKRVGGCVARDGLGMFKRLVALCWYDFQALSSCTFLTTLLIFEPSEEELILRLVERSGIPSRKWSWRARVSRVFSPEI